MHINTDPIFKMTKCRRFPSLIGLRQRAGELASLGFRDEDKAFNDLCAVKLGEVVKDQDGDSWERVA